MTFNNLGFGGGRGRNPFAMSAGINPSEQQQMIQQQAQQQAAQRLAQQQQQAQQAAVIQHQQEQAAAQQTAQQQQIAQRAAQQPSTPDRTLPIQQYGGLAQQQQAQQVPASPAPSPRRDFSEEYRKTVEDRPKRLAYEEAIKQGAPRIERSKWARLAAALGAGAIATSPEAGSAQMGYNMGRTALEAPQAKATAEYERRVKGLGDLAGMEEKDVVNKIRILEGQQKDYYDSEDLKLKQNQDVREGINTERQGKLTDMQIKNIQSEMDDRGWHLIEDDQDGYTYRVNNNGDKVRLIKSTSTTEEKYRALDRELTRRHDLDEESKRLDRKNQRDIAAAGNDRARDVANTQAQARVDAARERNTATVSRAAANLKPGEKNTGAWTAVAEAWTSDPDLRNYAMSDLLNGTEGASGSDILTVKPDVPYKEKYGGFVTEGDSPAEVRAKEKLRKILAKAYGTTTAAPPASAAGSSSTTKAPASKLPDGFSIR